MKPEIPLIRALSKRFPLMTILASAILVLMSVAIVISAKFNTEETRLIPAHAEKTALYFSLLEKVVGREKAYIVFTADNITDHIQEIEKIGDEISSSHQATTVSWKISDKSRASLRDVYARKAPLLLSAKEMQEFVRRLSPEGMARELDKTRQRLAGSENQEGPAIVDPLNFFELFGQRLHMAEGSPDLDSDYFMTPDRKKLLMTLTPAGSPRDPAFSQRFVSSIESILGKHRNKGLSAELTGIHAISVHEASVMKREIVTTLLLSFVTVTLIFFIFFRSLKGLLYVMLPVVNAIIMTWAVMLLFSGSLSEVTGAFGAIFAGIGIDLGIVLYARYLMNMERYPDPVERMDRSVKSVYRGTTTGVLITSLTFLVMVFSSYRGIRELGVMTAIAMLICWLFLFSLVSLAIKPSSGRHIGIKALKDIAIFCYTRPMKVIAAALVLALVPAVFIPRIEIRGDITRLGSATNSPRTVLEHMRDASVREEGVLITDMTMDMESALVRSIEIKEALARDFDNISAAGDILPPLVRQNNNLEQLSSLDPGRIIRDLNRLAVEKGFDPSGFGLFTERLRKMLQNREPITFRDIEPVQEVLERLLVNEDDQWRIVVTGNLRSDAPHTALSGYTYTGPAFIRQELSAILRKDTLLIGAITLLLMNIVLFRYFRRIFPVLLCQAPAAISIAMTLGIMGLTGMSLNFMNAIAFVFLFGIGTNNSFLLLHDYHIERNIGSSFLRTGEVVLVAGLTTVAGFSAIGFSSYKGLASMGQVAATGMSLSLVLSLTLLPSLLRLDKRGSAGLSDT